MTLRTTCAGCGKVIKAGDDWAGRAGKCPKCSAAIQFPDVDPFAGLEDFVASESALRPAIAVPIPPPFPHVPNLPEPVYLEPIAQQPTRYEYHMEQIPPTIVVQEAKGREASDYLQGVVSRFAHNGWEFYRVDEIGVQVSPGCLGFLMGIRAETRSHYVVTFRRVAE